ncbi:MAG: hypothetical protein RLZZ432_597, partial [Chloroflexota bacterium]
MSEHEERQPVAAAPSAGDLSAEL